MQAGVGGPPPQLEQQLLKCLAPFEQVFLATTLQRLNELITAAFPGGPRTLPAPADVQRCIGYGRSSAKPVGGGVCSYVLLWCLGLLVSYTCGVARRRCGGRWSCSNAAVWHVVLGVLFYFRLM